MLLDGTFDVNTNDWSTGPWWKREALESMARGWFQVIPSRDRSELYLLRFWLTAPLPGPDGRHESASSLLLHYFARGDDDESLHDHPWDFRTSILAGGYVEHLPPLDWSKDIGRGPAWNDRHAVRVVGDSVCHGAEDLHCVGQMRRDTWTAVRTGPRIRDWGFFPPNDVWTPWRQYLGLPVAA